MIDKALRERLLKSGYVFQCSVGGVSSGADISLSVGGGNGTTIDSDQPELIIGVASGYYLIPLYFFCSAQVDLDADAEVGNIILFADATQNAPSAPTGTAVTPRNCWPNGGASIARAWKLITADITAPVASQVLAYETIRAMDAGVAASEQVAQLSCRYDPQSPPIFTGPCSLVACWGGTAAVNAIAGLMWAEVPVGFQF